MPTLNIEGKRVKVDDSFLALSPEEQQRTVEEIAQQIGAKPQRAEPQEEGAPTNGGFLRGVDDAVRGAADMSTFGLSDEISAGLGAATGVGGTFGDYSGNLEQQRARDAEGGWARLGGQVVGAVAMPWSLARTIPAAIGQGIAMGGLYGFGSGEGGATERAKSASIGAAAGGAGGFLVRGAANAFGTRAARATIPDNAALKTASQAGYDMAERAGVLVRPEGIQRLATETVGDLAQYGYHPALQPKIGTVLSEMERLANTQSITYKGLDTLRRMVGQVASSSEPSERAMASRILARLDDFMENPRPNEVLAGDIGMASRGIQQGRENWARMRRSEMVDTAAIKAERRAASTGTGGNLENTLRQNTRAILDNPKRSRGMTPAELAMADRVVRGSAAQDLTRSLGRRMNSIHGAGVGGTVGAALAGPTGAAVGSLAVPAVGRGVVRVAERMTEKNVARLSEMIRSGGRTAQELAKLARGGQLTIPEVQRVEALAKIFGVSVPTLAAAVTEKLAGTTAR